MMINDSISELKALLQDNPLFQWIAAVIAAALIASIAKIIFGVVSNRLRKLTTRTRSAWDDVGVDIVDRLHGGVIFIWALFLLSRPVETTPTLQRSMLIGVVVISILQVAIWGLYIIRSWREQILKRKIENDPSSAAALGLLYTIVQALFIVIIVLIGLSNLGVNISALLAGLGVGGIAVALAAQNVLGDLLASLSIVLDKPFVVGDFIVTGNEKGTVEQIGLKTTRLRSLSGEEIIISNKNLLESRVQNFKRMWERRIVQSFGVVYSTPPETLEKIPVWVKGFVEKHGLLQFDRCHLNKYGASSLDYELVFIVKTPDYNIFMDIQQKILLDIIRKFAQEKVEFAYPTQSIVVQNLPEKAAATA